MCSVDFFSSSPSSSSSTSELHGIKKEKENEKRQSPTPDYNIREKERKKTIDYDCIKVNSSEVGGNDLTKFMTSMAYLDKISKDMHFFFRRKKEFIENDSAVCTKGNGLQRDREREMKYLPFEMSNRILFYSFEHIKSHRNQFFLSYRLLFAVSII